MYRWLGELWTTSGSRDSSTCPCTYATVIYEKVCTLTLKLIFFCSLTTKPICILDICWSLNILGLHLPLQDCPKHTVTSTVFPLALFTDTGFAIFNVLGFFPLSGSRVCTQFSFFVMSSWLLWLAHFLDFFPPLHFSASFNLPHCGVILERSFAGACLLAFSSFCSCSAIIKCKYQHTLMFCGPEAQSCIPVCLFLSFNLTLHLYVICTPNYQSLYLITDNIPWTVL